MSQVTSASELQKLDELKNMLEINKNDEKSIQVIVENTAKNILSNIVQVTEKIQDAKELVRDSENCESDWKNIFSLGVFGQSKTDKRAELNTRAISQQNEAMTEMNKLIQESLKLICCSIFFAKSMIETMSSMMVGGFKDTNGKTIALSEDQEKHANIILQQAKNFVEHQEQYELRQEKQEQEIKQNKQSIEQNRQDISQNAAAISHHTEQFGEYLGKYELRQESQELAIQTLQQDVSLLKAYSNKKAFYFSIIAIIISIVSIALQFIK